MVGAVVPADPAPHFARGWGLGHLVEVHVIVHSGTGGGQHLGMFGQVQLYVYGHVTL